MNRSEDKRALEVLHHSWCSMEGWIWNEERGWKVNNWEPKKWGSRWEKVKKNCSVILSTGVMWLTLEYYSYYVGEGSRFQGVFKFKLIYDLHMRGPGFNYSKDQSGPDFIRQLSYLIQTQVLHFNQQLHPWVSQTEPELRHFASTLTRRLYSV